MGGRLWKIKEYGRGIKEDKGNVGGILRKVQEYGRRIEVLCNIIGEKVLGKYGIWQKVWNRNYGRRVVGMAKENMDGKIGKEHMSGEIGIGDIEGLSLIHI